MPNPKAHLRHGAALHAAVGVLDDLDGAHLDAAAAAGALEEGGLLGVEVNLKLLLHLLGHAAQRAQACGQQHHDMRTHGVRVLGWVNASGPARPGLRAAAPRYAHTRAEGAGVGQCIRASAPRPAGSIAERRSKQQGCKCDAAQRAQACGQQQSHSHRRAGRRKRAERAKLPRAAATTARHQWHEYLLAFAAPPARCTLCKVQEARHAGPREACAGSQALVMRQPKPSPDSWS